MEFVPSPFVCGDAVAYRFGIKVTLSFLHVCPRANQRRICQWISNSNSLHHDVTFKMIMSLCFWWYVHLPLSPKHTQWKYWLVLGIHPIPWDRTFCMSMQYASNAHDSCAKADGMSLFLRHLCVVSHWMHNTYATFATTSSTSALTHGHPYGRHCQSNKSFSINEYNQQWTDAGGRAMILSISPNSICTHRYDKHTYIYIRNSIL